MQYTNLREILLLCLFISGLLSAQEQQQIEGRITDINGEPLLGVTIWIPEISKGTTTNPQGYFSLSTPTKSKLNLKISFVGYIPQTRVIKENNSFFENHTFNDHFSRCLMNQRRHSALTIDTINTRGQSFHLRGCVAINFIISK